MKAICKYNDGSIFRNREMPVGYSLETQFNLVLEKEYLIMGILLTEKSLFYLTDENSNPYWYPSVLFSITDSKLPSNWYFKHFKENSGNLFEAVWGYKELCLDKDYNDRLMEREENDLRIYFRHKLEFEVR